MSKLIKIITLSVFVVTIFSCGTTTKAVQNVSTVELVTIPGNDEIPTFQMGTTEVTNEQYKDFLNQAYKQGLITMTPSRKPYFTLDEYSDENMVFDKVTGNPLIYLGGSRVIKDHNKDGEIEVHEMENPLNRCYIEFNKEINEFQIVDPTKVDWQQYFDTTKYPGVVDSIDDWAELNSEKTGRFGYGDIDKKPPTIEEVATWPVTFVRYFGADAFAKFYGYDIPTQAQWKLAAAAGKEYMDSTNDGEEANSGITESGIDETAINVWFDPSDAAWLFGEPVPATHVQPVKRLAPNAYGLYSMGGNVYEWTADWYKPDPNQETDPFFNRTGEQFVDGEDGREPITLDDIRIDKTKPLSKNNQYLKSGIGGAHNFPSRALNIDAWNPHPFLAEANDHFGFRVAISSSTSQPTTKSSTSKKSRTMNPKTIMNFLDKDGDNKISLEEAKKAKKQTFANNFDKLDKNKDGYIDIEELKSFDINR